MRTNVRVHGQRCLGRAGKATIVPACRPRPAGKASQLKQRAACYFRWSNFHAETSFCTIRRCGRPPGETRFLRHVTGPALAEPRASACSRPIRRRSGASERTPSRQRTNHPPVRRPSQQRRNAGKSRLSLGAQIAHRFSYGAPSAAISDGAVRKNPRHASGPIRQPREAPPSRFWRRSEWPRMFSGWPRTA